MNFSKHHRQQRVILKMHTITLASLASLGTWLRPAKLTYSMDPQNTVGSSPANAQGSMSMVSDRLAVRRVRIGSSGVYPGASHPSSDSLSSPTRCQVSLSSGIHLSQLRCFDVSGLPSGPVLLCLCLLLQIEPQRKRTAKPLRLVRVKEEVGNQLAFSIVGYLACNCVLLTLIRRKISLRQIPSPSTFVSPRGKVYLMNSTTAMMKEPKAKEPKWYLKAQNKDCRTTPGSQICIKTSWTLLSWTSLISHSCTTGEWAECA